MIIGIDLGTTNSLAAYYGEDGPKIIPNRLGKHLTPSVVSVGEQGEVYVGETARELRSLHPEATAQVFKRSMGSGRKYRLRDQEFTAEELSSFVPESDEEEYRIVRTKKFPIKPMTVDEAVLQMELVGHTFFAFKDVDHDGRFCVVYKRNDGDYGLIEDEI